MSVLPAFRGTMRFAPPSSSALLTLKNVVRTMLPFSSVPPLEMRTVVL